MTPLFIVPSVFQTSALQNSGLEEESDHRMASTSDERTNKPNDVEPSDKPTIVRIKRKRSDNPIDALWLEVSGNRRKRQDINFSKLTLEDDPTLNKDAENSKKVFFRRVQTVDPSYAEDVSFSQSLLQTINEKSVERQKQPRPSILKSKDKQHSLLTSARKDHEAIGKNARLEQVWKRRRSHDSKHDLMHEFFRLYDVVHVNPEVEMPEGVSSSKKNGRDAEDELLESYLPLLRDYMPSLADEYIKKNTKSSSDNMSGTDDFVYDVYTQEETVDEDNDNYDILQVEEWGYGSCEERDPDYDSEDSNDESNPLNDYPDEEDQSEQEFCSEVETTDDEDDIDDHLGTSY